METTHTVYLADSFKSFPDFDRAIAFALTTIESGTFSGMIISCQVGMFKLDADLVRECSGPYVPLADQYDYTPVSLPDMDESDPLDFIGDGWDEGDSW